MSTDTIMIEVGRRAEKRDGHRFPQILNFELSCRYGVIESAPVMIRDDEGLPRLRDVDAPPALVLFDATRVAGARIRLDRPSGISVDGDIATVTLQQGTWYYRLHPAQFSDGRDWGRFYLGVWPD